MKLSECGILKRAGNSHKHHSFPKKELDGDYKSKSKSSRSALAT